MPNTFEITYNCGFYILRDNSRGEILGNYKERELALLAALNAANSRITAMQHPCWGLSFNKKAV